MTGEADDFEQRRGAAAQALSAGDFGGALSLCQNLINEYPANPHAYQIAAIASCQVGENDQAMMLQRLAVERAPEDFSIRLNLINMLQATEAPSDDLFAAFEQAHADFGPRAELMDLWGTTAFRKERHEESLRVLETAIEANPDHRIHWRNLSLPLLGLGREEEAVAAFGRSLTPWDGEPSPPPQPPTETYDGKAAAYDENWLQRSFGERMATFVGAVVGERKGMRILDVACGTGSFGENFQDHAPRLSGLDISPGMLEQAAAKGIYEDLQAGDFHQTLAAESRTFDALVSACALYHVADLTPFFDHAGRLIEAGGGLFFSVDPAAEDVDIAVSNPGEFAHSRRYLRRLAEASGFVETTIEIMPHRLYPGFWCAFQKV